MKDFEPHKSQVVIEEKVVKEIHFHFVKQQSIRPGHTLFKFDTNTGILEPVKRDKKTYEKIIVPKKPKVAKHISILEPVPPGIIHTQAPYDPSSLYFSALNMENAIKKVNKLVGFDLGFNKL